MNPALTEETLEEGRVALYRLERQLKEHHTRVDATSDNRDNRSESSSQRHSVSSDRRLLDQLPRTTRLNQRLESLGLTVEELDDRGLLDGGGSVPSYYTSMKQKNRRGMELQPRSHRLQERGKEALSKLLNALFHMLRTVSKRGLNLEEYFRGLDNDRKGLLHRKQFYATLKKIGLPFNTKELQDIVLHYTYQSPPNNNQNNNAVTSSSSSDLVDYLLFLKDARLLKKSAGSNIATNNNSKHYDFQEEKLGSYMSILHDVKRMLLDAIRSLGKHPDDIYRTFARWDTQGTGTVTATQFLRVLARLHIDLSDQDQDFIVELLDTNAMGRIDFESLLAFCFSSLDPDLLQSPNGIIVGTAIGFDDAAGETLSAVSLENNSLDMRSTGSGNGGTFNSKRPQTASISRPYGGGSAGGRHALDGGSKIISGVESSVGDDPFGGKSSSMVLPSPSAMNNNTNVHRNRPMTASARVNGGGSSNKRVGSQQSIQVSRKKDIDEGIMLEDLPDDVINGEENFLNPGRDKPDEPIPQPPDNGIGIPSAFGLLSGRPVPDHTNDPHNYELPIDPASYARMFPDEQEPISPMETPSSRANEPSDHLVLLANQILTTLRDIILARYRRGRSLREIYQHFDRDGKGYFDAVDFRQATADLRIETSEKVAMIAIRQIALDGITQVTFGEFKVFVLDSDHHLLALNIQEQLAHLLEQQGRDYGSWMMDCFWAEEESLSFSDSQSRTLMAFMKDRQQGLISKIAFVNALKRIGLVLTPSEVGRLVDRFDLHGNEMCSALRFINMIQSSNSWKHAETVLVLQDQAIEEAAYLRQQRTKGDLSGIQLPDLSEELISMCEYLGIRVLSEKDMIWIASDALKAPLPVNWTAEKDSQGRTFFYNHLTNQSRWEHPLDPHFRNLRDKYRQSNELPSMSSHLNGGNTTEELDSSVRPRGVVLPSTKPPQLESQFPSKPLPGPSSSSTRNVLPSSQKVGQPLRPQSATQEISMYHHPTNYSALKGLDGVEEQKRELKANLGMGDSKGGKRPVSAPQHQQSTNPALVANPAGILSSLLNKPSSNQEPQQLTKNNYFLPTGTTISYQSTAPANNKEIIAQSRNMIEQVYHTPVINFPHGNNKNRSKSASHGRPSSSHGSSALLTTVDRALSIGKTSQLILQERDHILKGNAGGGRLRRDGQGNVIIDSEVRTHLLSDMLEGNIIEKLDNAILAGRR